EDGGRRGARERGLRGRGGVRRHLDARIGRGVTWGRAGVAGRERGEEQGRENEDPGTHPGLQVTWCDPREPDREGRVKQVVPILSPSSDRRTGSWGQRWRRLLMTTRNAWWLKGFSSRMFGT